MQLYNHNIEQVGWYKTIDTKDGILYPSKLTEEELNSYEYYFIERTSPPNRRYYTYEKSSSLVGNKYIEGYISTDKAIETVQEAMLQDLKAVFENKEERPKVDTSLGYIVDGGRKDLENFQIGKEVGFPGVKDANGDTHPVSAEDYDVIILAIKSYGMSLYQQKWAKEVEIKALTTVQECIDYEYEPYEYTITQEDVANAPEGSLEVGQIITRYRNNVKEW